MKVIELNGKVINIGDWDYKEIITTDSKGNKIIEITNPLPDGAVEVEATVVHTPDGGRCLDTDYKALRKYPTIKVQLDYIYHNGIEAWKNDIIKPIKDKHPKPVK